MEPVLIGRRRGNQSLSTAADLEDLFRRRSGTGSNAGDR